MAFHRGLSGLLRDGLAHVQIGNLALRPLGLCPLQYRRYQDMA